MFISFSKFLGKTGIHVGVGFNLGGKKKSSSGAKLRAGSRKKSGGCLTACVSACASICVLMLQIMLYTILFSVWVCYAMVYGFVWIIKTIISSVSKKRPNTQPDYPPIPKSDDLDSNYQKIDDGQILGTFQVNNTKMTLKYDGLYVKKRIKPINLVKSKQGLFPHEILMLSYVTKFHTGKNNFQSFWRYKYNEDPQTMINKLISDGFVEVGNDMYTVLKNETVDKLKSVLSSCGEKVSGRKEELINRVIEKVPPHTIEENFPLRYFALTEKGAAELSDNIHVIHCHRDGGDLWDHPFLL